MSLKRFLFQTGVQVYKLTNPTYRHREGNLVQPNGVLAIPFFCEDVPENATFVYACDHVIPGDEHLLKREIHNSNMISKYAFFKVPQNIS